MRVVARQENGLTGDHKLVAGAIPDPDTQRSLDDVVIKDDVGRRAERRLALLGRNAGRHAPRCEKVGAQEHSAGQVRDLQDIGERVHTCPLRGSGISVMFAGGQIIELRASPTY